MSEFTSVDIQHIREAQKMPRWKLASLVGVSEATIVRWEAWDAPHNERKRDGCKERERVMPEPNDVDRIGDALGDPTIWHRWMLSHYDSYRRRYTEVAAQDLSSAVHQAQYEIEDVLALQGKLGRDALDGRIDDPDLKERYIKEAREAIASLQQVLDRI